MFERKTEKQEGQSIVLVAAAMVVLLIFVALAVDMSSAYVMRRKLQNGADGAALAAVRRMSHQLNTAGGFADGPIHEEVIDFAERNTLNGSGGTLADIGGSVVGLYVDRSHEPIPDAIVGDGDPVHPDAWGVQATVYGIAPSFFGGILGRDGYPVQATATACLEPTCGENC